MVPVRQVDKIEFHTCRKGNPNKRQRMTSWRTSVPFSFSICTGGQNYRPHHMFIKEESSCFWCLWGLWNLVYQNSVGQLKENLHPTKIPWYKISIPCLKRHHKTSLQGQCCKDRITACVLLFGAVILLNSFCLIFNLGPRSSSLTGGQWTKW